MTRLGFALLFTSLLVTSGVASFPAHAQSQEEPAEQEEKKKRSWSNTTDLSFVLTDGNSQTESFGFTSDFRQKWKQSAVLLKLQATLKNTDDDPFLQVDPGLTFLPGESPTDPPTTLVDPGSEPDVEKYFAETRFERSISGQDVKRFKRGFKWNVGATWDRDVDAGILSRTVLFSGVGHDWWDRDDFKFNTAYSLSYTQRDEENPDPDKDQEFAGFRFSWDYLNQWGKATTFENDWFFNVSLSDLNDWSSNMVTSLDVAMTEKLALKISLQWLFNNEPALEDVDIVGFVILVDPDGVPGSGDEFFETVGEDDPDAFEIVVGEDRVRKKKLDTVFRTSLSIKF
jgi:putative salt-induced outer membrane protein YdiY